MAEETGFRRKIIDALGLGELDDEFDGYEDEDLEEDEFYPQTEPEQVQETMVSQERRTVVKEPASPDVLVLDPTTFDEAPGIVNKLKQDKTIVVNLKQTEFEEGRKIFDFLSGAVFALEGSLNRIAESVFILAPKKISVATQMDEPIQQPTSEYSADILTWNDTE